MDRILKVDPPPGPARSGLPKTNDMVTRVRCHKLLGNCRPLNWTENQFSCKLWPNFGVKLKMFVALVCGLHRQSCDLLLHGHVGVEKSWGRVSLSQYQHLQQQVFWGFHSLDGSNDSWDLMSRGTNKSNSWQVYDLQRSLHQPALTSDKHTYPLSCGSCIQCLKIHGPFCWARIKRRLAFMNFTLAYWPLLELLHFFSPKDLCPSNIFLISPSPLDHSSSLILERSEICKKFLFYSIKTSQKVKENLSKLRSTILLTTIIVLKHPTSSCSFFKSNVSSQTFNEVSLIEVCAIFLQLQRVRQRADVMLHVVCQMQVEHLPLNSYRTWELVKRSCRWQYPKWYISDQISMTWNKTSNKTSN